MVILFSANGSYLCTHTTDGMSVIGDIRFKSASTIVCQQNYYTAKTDNKVN